MEMEKINCQPMVSILLITYNHEQYIRQALDGILIQKVDFQYEIIVHDDASTDNTAEIISEYEKKHPKKIKAIYQTENLYQKGISALQFILEYLVGKYIAICEGDDYWTDSLKLKKQIEFLEANKDFIATAHNVCVIDENGELISENINPYKIFPTYTFTLSDAEQIKLPSQMSSIVYRNIWLNLDNCIVETYQALVMNGDQKLAVLLTLHGKIFCFSEIMANHRKIISHGMSWSARTQGKNLCSHRYISILEINRFVEKYYGVKFNNRNIQLNYAYESFVKLLHNFNKENWKIFKDIIIISGNKRNKIFLHIIGKIITLTFRKLIRRYINKKRELNYED